MGPEPRDRLLAEVHRLLLAGVTGQAFPGAAACVSYRDAGGREQVVVACAGTLAKGEPAVQPQTRYDLGRMTECFVSVAALRMAARGALDLDAPAESVLADLRGAGLGDTSLRALLWHRGDLAAWGGLYLDVPHELGSIAARRWLINEAARRKSERPPGRVERSDLGYIIVGEALARAADATLDGVVAREVLAPLGIEGEVCFAGGLSVEERAAFVRQVAPTERCEWRGRLVRGEVHDENAAALGGVAGHAGLFGSARCVALLGRALLDALARRRDFLPARVIDGALTAGDEHVRPGWERKHGPKPACGRRMGPKSFGQLAITGTSIWCDPERDVVVVLLTNRICPSRANERIDGFRPAFHDGVLAMLGA